MLDVAIVGGGITGLACARKLHESNRDLSDPVRFCLFEAQSALGGHIRTEVRDGFVLEEGPDAFLSVKPQALDLIRRLGLENEVIGTRPGNRRVFVASGGALRAFPEGFYMIAPSQIPPLMFSSLLSLKGKLRMLADLWLPAKSGDREETAADFVKRRLGREAFEKIAQPILSGIYAGDPELLSASLVLPQFCEMEARGGSLIRGLMEASRRKSAGSGAGARYSLFVTLRGGLRRLVEKIEEDLPADTVCRGSGIETLRRDADGQRWVLVLSGGRSVTARSVVFSTGAPEAARLVQSVSPGIAGLLRQILCEPSVIWNAAYREDQISRRPEGFGFVVPAAERSAILACSFTSVKFEGRAPAGILLVRIFCGGTFGRPFAEMDPEELWRHVEKDLRRWAGLRGEPVLRRRSVWPASMPQYHLGHKLRVERIREQARALKGLWFAGGAYDGVGIPDCVRQGEEAARAVIKEKGPAPGAPASTGEGLPSEGSF